MDERQLQATSAGKKSKAVAKKVYRSKGLPGTEKLLWIFVILLCCSIAGFYQFRQSAAYELNSQIIQMESEIRQLEEQNAMLKNEVAKLQSPERLIESGIQLGLVQQGDVPSATSFNGGTVALNAAE